MSYRGCILYELLCGSPPFEGSSPVECLAMHLYDEPVPPSQRARGPVDKALETTALWCLEKVPESRPQTIDEVKVALLEALDRPSDGAMLARALEETTRWREQRAGVIHGPVRPSGFGSQRAADRPGSRKAVG